MNRTFCHIKHVIAVNSVILGNAVDRSVRSRNRSRVCNIFLIHICRVRLVYRRLVYRIGEKVKTTLLP